MQNRKDYYDNRYEPSAWRTGIKSPTLRIQVKQVETRKRQGAYQEPYETTCAAMIELLDKADVYVTGLLIEMGKMAEELAQAKLALAGVDNTKKDVKKDETVQSEVGRPLQKGPVSNPAPTPGRDTPKPKQAPAGNSGVVGTKRK